MDSSEIEKLIPHRDPFLWIDRVTEITETGIRATKEIDAALDVFRGHYPHFPVLPGVLILEACFQAGAIFISRTAEIDAGMVPVVTRVNNVKFRQMVRPGDTLDIEAELTEQLSNAYFFTAKATVAGKVAARVEFACAEAPAE
ncbi:3-hydroxyacyl-[acyl-carrier-protein] dehydratase FabZ [Symmachiella macrocystis]|uniref:3-hydroxyacyl-[acyl-carrier-protein] dehydratase FabZ n=1 Tax=Symmachiella macrocystis TaxID=2527985 RepID=A0A5C6BQL6_9PLAN|nr:3-hydroxyacyl-ACP dehydratase FabZ [Symmachiella macrocystis]TWU14348.1 3-hydroxyacyl-[acyl-carrier-protein] dehydratase FabZ [Symmachiella macrocystis]